jgi:hypothetical protein
MKKLHVFILVACFFAAPNTNIFGITKEETQDLLQITQDLERSSKKQKITDICKLRTLSTGKIISRLDTLFAVNDANKDIDDMRETEKDPEVLAYIQDAHNALDAREDEIARIAIKHSARIQQILIGDKLKALDESSSTDISNSPKQ